MKLVTTIHDIFFPNQALHYKKYSTASDVWSFGAVMYEIWSVGHKPFENETNVKVRFLFGLTIVAIHIIVRNRSCSYWSLDIVSPLPLAVPVHSTTS